MPTSVLLPPSPASGSAPTKGSLLPLLPYGTALVLRGAGRAWLGSQEGDGGQGLPGKAALPTQPPTPALRFSSGSNT